MLPSYYKNKRTLSSASGISVVSLAFPSSVEPHVPRPRRRLGDSSQSCRDTAVQAARPPVVSAVPRSFHSQHALRKCVRECRCLWQGPVLKSPKLKMTQSKILFWVFCLCHCLLCLLLPWVRLSR